MVEDDNPIIGSVTQKFGRGIIGLKENVDLEMGGMISEDNGIPLPNIFQSLDCGGIDDNLTKKGGGGKWYI